MKHIFSKTKALLIVLCAGWGLLSTSCISEDLDACKSHRLILKVLNAAEEEITGSGRAADATIFVFDGDKKYLETVTMTQQQIISETPITLKTPYKEGMKLYFIAWGNVSADQMQVAEGTAMSEFTVQLRNSNGLAEEPSDMFYGNENITTAEGDLKKDEIIYIRPKMAQVELETQGLPYYLAKLEREGGLRAEGDEFAFTVDKTLSKFNSEGTMVGDSVYYMPESEWDARKGLTEWHTPALSNICTGEDITGSFYFNDEEFSFIQYNEEGPITAVPEGNYLLVFVWGEDGEYLGVKVQVRPWGFIDDEIIW